MSKLTRTRLYTTWKSMKARCYNPSHKSYALYGGRGIIVCPQWLASFQCFKDWAMSTDYQEHLTIDRYPNKDGDYEPDNCRWATWKEQERNRNNNIAPITAFGETKPIWDWLEDSRCTVSRNTLLLRLGTGRDPEWSMTAETLKVTRRRKPHSEETKLRMSEAAKNRKARTV